MTAPASRLLKLELHSFWHPGTGRGDGAAADAVVHRDADGLPELPGRTVKGLLRAACELSVAARVDWSLRTNPADKGGGVAWLFGSPLAKAGGAEPAITPATRIRELERRRYASQAGRLRVESARLGESSVQQAAWRGFAGKHPAALDHLRRTLATTQLDDNGVAADKTLRSVEVLVPMTLHARLTFEAHPDDERGLAVAEWERLCKLLDQAARLFLRGIGSGRNRGLGRCSASIEVPRD